MEPVGIGRGSVRAKRGSGVVVGGAGVRREAGPVTSTRLALERAGGTFKTIAGAKRRRGIRGWKGGTKRGTLRGRWGERHRKVREEKVVGDVHERATSGRGGSRRLGAVPTKRGGCRGVGSVCAEAAVGYAEGLQGVEGDAAQGRRRGRVVVQGE